MALGLSPPKYPYVPKIDQALPRQHSRSGLRILLQCFILGGVAKSTRGELPNRGFFDGLGVDREDCPTVSKSVVDLISVPRSYRRSP